VENPTTPWLGYPRPSVWSRSDILDDVRTRIHDDEPDTGELVVRSLLQAECPQWSSMPIEYLSTSGTDNAMWRIRTDGEPDLVVRLPRRPGAAAGVLQEMDVLQQVDGGLGSAVHTPTIRHIGQPHDVFAHHWSVLEWIEGTDCWSARDRLDSPALSTLATDLAAAVLAIGQLDTHGVQQRSAGSRGGPLLPLLERLDGWLNNPEWNATHLIDVVAVRRLAAEGREVADETVPSGFVHGDLIPGNLLVDRNRLSAIIDWGGAGQGDPAQDLAPAWAVLTASERPAFRDAVGGDDSAWIRGRTFELEHAVGGVLYYLPRQHLLGEVMSRTLGRIIEDS
jgi:aminoglycoside phosphotransferase (APT) family kinase protein